MLYTKEELEEAIKNKIDESQKRFGKDFKFALIEIYSLMMQLNPTQEKEKKEELIELSQWNKYYPRPSVGALRQYVHRQHKNGFDKVITYGGENGNRVLIYPDRFFKWEEERAKGRHTIQ